MNLLLYFALPSGILALLFAGRLIRQIKHMAPGSDRMMEISAAIATGAQSFLKRQYKTLFLFVFLMVAVLFSAGLLLDGKASLPPETAVAFVLGAFCSILAGNIGMRTATKANVRTANAAAQDGMGQALSCAFSGGAVLGLCVVGLGLLGLILTLLLFPEAVAIVNGFGLGASSVALFGRVGGGIYTKAADIGADLVGKVEIGIPEDDPRNPAVIADNVGDNVGDVAGMGSDLFESYVGALLSALVLGHALGIGQNGEGMLAPLLVAAVGIFASLISVCYVKTGREGDPQRKLEQGNILATALTLVGVFAVCMLLLADGYTINGRFFSPWGVFFSVFAGLMVGYLIGRVTEYHTSTAYPPVQRLAQACQWGTATNIIRGLALGMLSTAGPVLLVVIGILAAYQCAGLYGIAMAAVGMLSITGTVVAVDAYGPIADNAGGIAEMAGLPATVRKITDQLDAVGNTTAAVGKGFAIGSAALTSLALFSAYTQAVGLQGIDLMDPRVTIGLFLGGMLPFLFCALTMNSVGRAAQDMIEEVRRQFRKNPQLLSGTAKADYARCVDISCRAALREMVAPSLMAVLAPFVVGLLLGPASLGGLLSGTLVTGFLLAVFMANSGGAWDNAKKYIEAGHYGGKGSPAHAASVNGDTVGDPCKDTAGPSLNILIKLMSIIALVFAPIFL